MHTIMSAPLCSPILGKPELPCVRCQVAKGRRAQSQPGCDAALSRCVASVDEGLLAKLPWRSGGGARCEPTGGHGGVGCEQRWMGADGGGGSGQAWGGEWRPCGDSNIVHASVEDPIPHASVEDPIAHASVEDRDILEARRRFFSGQRDADALSAADAAQELAGLRRARRSSCRASHPPPPKLHPCLSRALDEVQASTADAMLSFRQAMDGSEGAGGDAAHAAGWIHFESTAEESSRNSHGPAPKQGGASAPSAVRGASGQGEGRIATGTRLGSVRLECRADTLPAPQTRPNAQPAATGAKSGEDRRRGDSAVPARPAASTSDRTAAVAAVYGLKVAEEQDGFESIIAHTDSQLDVGWTIGLRPSIRQAGIALLGREH